MKIRDIIVESGMEPMGKEHEAALQSAVTFPDQNSSTGSSYLNYRFGIALAGAPDYPTKADNWIGGDPLAVPYTPEEMDMINFAAEQTGDRSKQTWSGDRSKEIAAVQRVSPVQSRGPIQLKKKK